MRTTNDGRRQRNGAVAAWRMLAVAGLALACAGCLEEEVRHTLYVERDGSVSWLAVQEEVRSGLDDPHAAQMEEHRFLEAARRGEHDVAEALWAAGARSVETDLLRDRRPFAVVTEARFGSLDHALEGLFGLGATEVRARLFRDGDLERLELGGRLASEPAEAFLRLVAAEEIVVTLADGVFVEAHGFQLTDDRRQARLLAPAEADAGDGAAFEAVLSWRWR